MNPSSALATVLVDELVRGGVRHVVLCPGSRSAPLAYALHEADAQRRLTLHVRIDERSAAFVALGLAKVGGAVAVVTTSGTAVANLHPAVLEASHGGVPLVVVTADRPPELRGTGANQTTQQVGIFGSAVRWSHDLGTPENRTGQVAAWRATVCRGLAAATGARRSAPGPVHLNVPLREPLVPDADPAFVEPLDGRAGAAPWVEVAPDLSAVTGDRSEQPASVLDLGPRTLVLVGDLPPNGPDWGAFAADLAAAHGWPLVAEPTARGARARAVPGGSLLLTCTKWVDAHRPEQVLVVGRVTLARSAAALLRSPSTQVEVVSDDLTWPDPSHSATTVHRLSALRDAAGRRAPHPPAGELGGAATGAAPGSPHTPAQQSGSAWCEVWHSAGRRVEAAAREAVTATWPSGPAVADALACALPPGSVLFAGSSTAVRDLDLVGGGLPGVVANRGVAGIDGCVSTAVGLALGGTAPTYAVVGDLTFVHDATALVIGPGEPQPDLTVVVVNDDGGGIFSLLEPGAPELVEPYERIFGTPHGTHLGHLCAATGTRYVRADDRTALVAALAARPSGRTVVEVRIDRDSHRSASRRLREAASRAALNA